MKKARTASSATTTSALFVIAVTLAACSGGATGGGGAGGGGGSGGGGGGGGGINVATAIVGSWLGPQLSPAGSPNQCSSVGTTSFSFNSDGTWNSNTVTTEACGGSVALGGRYSVNGTSLGLTFTDCPESCPSPITETVNFVDNDHFSFSDESGTYTRQ